MVAVAEESTTKRMRAVELRGQGLSHAKIAKELGVNVNTVVSWVPIEEPHNPTRTEEALKLRAEGLTQAEIGRRLGITRQRVQQLLGPDDGPPPLEDLTTVYLTRRAAEHLRDQALRFGFRAPRGSRAKDGDIARFLEAVADGKIGFARTKRQG